jgi:uncharacterized peroxidase-related enzyme
MSRITAIDPKSAAGDSKSLLDAALAKLGVVPNFLRVLAHSPHALGGFLGLYGALGHASLGAALQERIALAVAESNACEYCVSAHTAIGRKVGLTNDEILLARQGGADGTRDAAAVAFARLLNERAGELTDAEFDAARKALSDAELVEIVAVVSLNFMTNILGKAARVDIDFPKISLLAPARAAA